MAFFSDVLTAVVSRQVKSHIKARTQTISINGQEWKYLSQGSKTGEPVLFLHGLGTNRTIWRTLLASNDDKTHLRLAVDVPGACRTQFLQNKRHTLQELARWLDSYLETLELSKVHLTAHSTMTLVAAFYAATRPEKVASLTLISVPDIWTSEARQPGGSIDRFRKIIQFNTPDDWVRQANPMFHSPPKIPKTAINRLFDEHMRNLDQFMEIMDEFVSSIPLIVSHTKKVRCPILIVNGESDVYSCKDFGETMHRHFSDTSVVQLKRAGHMPMLEKPRELEKLHTEFLVNGSVNLDNSCEWGRVFNSR